MSPDVKKEKKLKKRNQGKLFGASKQEELD